MMNRRFTVERSSMITKTIVVATALALGVGCASAETKLASKQSYRDAQVRAIKVQKEADILSAQAASAERVAMWNALSDAVKANPDTASHMAIVAAVASTRGSNGETVTQGNVVQLRPERDTTALDWAKVLAPGLIGGVTQAGLAAISAETQRDSIQANRDIRVQEIVTDGQVWSLMNNIVDEYDDDELTMVTTTTETSDSTVTVTEPNPDTIVVEQPTVSDETTAVDEPADTTDSTDTTDDTVEMVDDGLDSGDDTTTPDDTTVEPAEVDCSVTFSPVPPECS